MSSDSVLPTILVVDDEPDLVDNIALALEADGYQILSAADGEEALAVLGARDVDLILADIAMPKLNGYQLYQRVRSNPSWLTIPFVFLTARRLDSDVRYGKELGVDDYLTKPIHTDDLLSVVRGKLRRGRELERLQPSLPVVQSPVRPRLTQRLTWGRIELDVDQHRAWHGDREIRLSAREFTLLQHLIHQAGKLSSAQELIAITHDLQLDDQEAGSLLRPLIRSLRRKLGFEIGEMGSIENVRGLGYRMSLPDS